jgi:DNA mismatch endonuclease (patch repair protein)
MGFRYSLFRGDLPGKPDLVFAPRKKIIFIHGCFWHGHRKKGCLDGRLPKSNLEYWVPKIASNRQRDSRHRHTLKKAGWRILEIWECETRDAPSLKRKIRKFLGPRVPLAK